MSTPSDDAQRELERRALRNVRGLIDKMEQTDEVDARAQKRVLVGIFAGAVVLALVIAVTLMFSKPQASTTIYTSKPAAAPQAPQK